MVATIFFVAASPLAFPALSVWGEEAEVDYMTQVRPLLEHRCYACHGALKQEGGLRLDTAKLILEGGDSGAAISVGDATDTSLLLERISTTDLSYRMPPEHEAEPFRADQIALIRRWIAAGAPAPQDEKPEADPQDHWSFQPIVRPLDPSVQNSDWVRNPIDLWIAQGHQQQGLVSQPEASRSTLLRRLSIDLIGLPPTAEEIAAVEADPSADWYEKVVERLLSDSRYGERWGRHWMDIWRYSDWWGLGDQLRNSQRHMWHWRDWIVQSLNDDLPYDEMLRLMLAADELAPEDPDKLRATGFLARNYYIFNRTQWMDNVVAHVGKGMLGLTFDCAKCHDHKYDPITHEDFFKMRAFFEPYHVRVDMVPGETDLTRDGIPRVFDGELEAPTYLFIRGDESQPDKSKVIAPGVPELLEFEELSIEPVDLPPTAWQPGRRLWVLENHVAAARERLQEAKAKRDQLASMLNPADAEVPDTESDSPEFMPIQESFTTLDSKRWVVAGEGWIHAPGKLKQTQDGPVSSTVTLRNPAPRDFEAELRFHLLGGSRWRSVGLHFDASLPSASPAAAHDTYQMIYLSGSTEDPKVQGATTKGSETTYAREAKKPFSIELGQEYTLRVQARDDLVNVSVNGEHVLSWRTPLPRRGGNIRLMTFDALAAIHEFKLSALDRSVSLIEPEGGTPGNVEEQHQLAEAEVRSAEAELAAMKLRAAAIHSQQQDEEASLHQEKRVAAIKAERRSAVEKAKREVLTAELALAKAGDQAKPDAEQKLAAAQAALKQKQASAEADIQPEDGLTLLPGAEWSPTRFQFTGKDDPQVSFPAMSTGRRKSLALWVTDRRNPLTARVAVNHLWNRHFGAPLASSTFNFGRNSPPPHHPELLDWLAAEFVEQGWSMKHLHRLIVTSATYRMSSSIQGAEANVAADPDNHYWWRRNPIRLESEAVRDSILSLAGTLDSNAGGPPVPSSEQETSKRRSMYFFHSNNERNLFLTTFDQAEVAECYQREQSVVPQQALAMTNSKLVLEAAGQIADRVAERSADDPEFVRQAFILVLAAHPSDEEIAASLAALDKWQTSPEGSHEQARRLFIWVLLNHNDFVTLR
ncbi:MAG: DUF1553 domain-containing protein [Pirellulaceae bacterium]